MSWSVLCDAPTQSVGNAPEALAMAIDPRTQTIRLGLRSLGATSQEINSGAILMRYLEATQADWAPVREWLLSTAAAPLLSAIAEGYSAEQLWSGDWSAHWTETAWSAATTLHGQVEALVQCDR